MAGMSPQQLEQMQAQGIQQFREDLSKAPGALAEGVGNFAQFLSEDPERTAKLAGLLTDAGGAAEAFGYYPDPFNEGEFLPSSYQQFKEADSAADVGLATLGVFGAIPIVGAPFRALKALRQIDRLKKRDMQPPEVLEFLKENPEIEQRAKGGHCLLYTSPSPRDRTRSRMPSSA